MSREQNGSPVHMVRKLSLHRGVETCCGALVPMEQATSDWRGVTCKAKGCMAEQQQRFEDYLKLKNLWRKDEIK
jgi:hypothetical protein